MNNDISKWCSDVTAYLTAAADGSISRNNSENLAAELLAGITFIEMANDAKRWRWLREQRGWPETEMSALNQPPEWFDALADQGMDDEGK